MDPFDFHKLQFRKVLEGLENHWLKILNLKDKSDFDKRDITDFVPWFGNMEGWLAKLKNINYGAYSEFDLSPAKIYPKALCDEANIHDIAAELDLLLPKDDPAVRSILPVLITGYITNRRGPTSKSKAGGSVVEYNGTPEFVNLLLYGEGPKQLKDNKNEDTKKPPRKLVPKKMMRDKTKLFVLKEWNDSFPKLKYSQLTKGKAQMLLSGYGCMRLFFSLLYQLQDICNVSLSYFMFEMMTRYADLMTNDGKLAWEKNNRAGYPWFANEEEVLNDSKKSTIISWIKKEFSDLTGTIEHEGDSSEKILPISLYKYLYNIKEALIEREEKERGTPLSDTEIGAGYKLFADLDFIFGKQNDGLPLSDLLDNDILDEILSEDVKDMKE